MPSLIYNIGFSILLSINSYQEIFEKLYSHSILLFYVITIHFWLLLIKNIEINPFNCYTSIADSCLHHINVKIPLFLPFSNLTHPNSQNQREFWFLLDMKPFSGYRTGYYLETFNNPMFYHLQQSMLLNFYNFWFLAKLYFQNHLAYNNFNST